VVVTKVAPATILVHVRNSFTDRAGESPFDFVTAVTNVFFPLVTTVTSESGKDSWGKSDSSVFKHDIC